MKKKKHGRVKMADLSGEKIGSTEYPACLEIGQGRKQHEAKQKVVMGVQSTTSALSFFPSAEPTIKTGLRFHFHMIPSKTNSHLCSISVIKVSSDRLVLWMRPKPDSDFSSEKAF